MIASVVVPSDIHGVRPALEAVLAEPDVVGAERIVLTGDIAAGPQPVEPVCEQSSYPGVAEWADYFLYSRATDAEALTTFDPRDGR